MRRLAPVAIVLVLALMFASSSSTQDIGKASSGQAAAPSAQEGESTALKTFSCPSACGFSVTSRSEDEVVGIVIGHARTFHQKKLSPDDVKAQLTVHQKKMK
jgi:predicted small metal-binding protein